MVSEIENRFDFETSLNVLHLHNLNLNANTNTKPITKICPFPNTIFPSRNCKELVKEAMLLNDTVY